MTRVNVRPGCSGGASRWLVLHNDSDGVCVCVCGGGVLRKSKNLIVLEIKTKTNKSTQYLFAKARHTCVVALMLLAVRFDSSTTLSPSMLPPSVYVAALSPPSETRSTPLSDRVADPPLMDRPREDGDSDCRRSCRLPASAATKRRSAGPPPSSGLPASDELASSAALDAPFCIHTGDDGAAPSSPSSSSSSSS
jgi:hypothetical protein